MADQSDLTKVKRSKFLSVTLVALAAITCTLALVYFYLRPEAPCYWSDFNSYEWATRFSLTRLEKDPLFYPILLLGSVSLQHNLFFTVALLPVMALLGAGRQAYISATALTYLLPLAYLIVQLSKAVQISPTKGIARSLLVVLLLPTMWAPCLRGYPDCGAALTLMGALLLYVSKRNFNSAKRGAAIGFLLALTVLLRRYFAFAGMALVVTIFVDQLLILKSRPILKESDPAGADINFTLKAKMRTFLALIGGGALTMLCLGLPFLLNLTRLNLGALYDSYHVTPQTSVAYFFSCFGLITILFSISGYAFALRARRVATSKVIFVIAFFVLAETLWICGPGELGTHYTLYFSPLVALGMVLLLDAVCAASFSRLQKSLLLVPLSLFLCLNFTFSLMPAKIADRAGLQLFRPGMLSYADQEGKGAALLFSAGYSANIRDDMPALRAIVANLRPAYASESTAAITSGQAPETDNDQTNPLSRRDQVCVIASSNLLNSEVLRNTERSMYGLDRDVVPWLELPVVDSKDSYPLERLLACRYVIVPARALYFIPPAGQTLLEAALACFDQHWPLADDFEVEPGDYMLADGVKVKIFQRRRATSALTAALTLKKMQDYVGEEPGSQPIWTTTGLLSQICYEKKRDSWLFLPARNDRPYLLYSAKQGLPKNFTLSGALKTNAAAPPTSLRARQFDAEGKEISSTILARAGAKNKAAAVAPFSQTLTNKEATFLVLELIYDLDTGVTALKQSARVSLDNLQLKTPL
ncbi:MAG: hypothetical protein KGS72_08255 [Cyanobacteria bacterium REEB67]|nr:hypothetical protein [Cyanobacteria bacterium REEB67]